MNKLLEIWYWLKHDPKARLIFAFSLVSICAIVVALIFRSTESDTVNDFTFQIPKAQVTTQNFEDPTILEKVSNIPLGISSSMVFMPDNQIAYINQDFKLVLGQKVASENQFVANNLYISRDGIIVNENDISSIYFNYGTLQNFPSGISEVTPVLLNDEFGLPNIAGYAFLQDIGGGKFAMKEADDIGLKTNLKTVIDIQLPTDFSVVEIRVLNDQPYIVFYQNSSRQGAMEIWQVGSNTERVQAINDVQSVKFGAKQVMITSKAEVENQLTDLNQQIIDFSANPKGDLIDINNLAILLGQDKIYGNILAERCDFGLNTEIYCLVKENRVQSSQILNRDLLSLYNYQSKEISYPYKNITFSASSIHRSTNGLLYIVGGQDQLPYLLKGKK